MKNPPTQHEMYVKNRQKNWQRVSEVADIKSDADHSIGAIENALAHVKKLTGKLAKLQSTITKEYEEDK